MIIIVHLVKVSVTVLTAVYLIKINQQKKELEILNDNL